MTTKTKRSQTHHLVVVESPAKARTIGRYLGSNYTVKASGGHVRDLPEGKLGINIDKAFTPDYVVIKGKKATIGELQKAAEGADSVYLATDPDREGEAISWHLKEAAGWHRIPVHRVAFYEITPEAIRNAFQHHRDIDMQLVNAQQARRILDRLVGYQLSPLLWRKVQRGLSAGRVQSVALRLVVERDQSIEAFTPVEYWELHAALQTPAGAAFDAAFHGEPGDRKAMELPDQATVERVVQALDGASYAVTKVTQRQVKRQPPAPFITSTLQQEGWRRLRFSARKVMALAQQLYEGMPLGSEGSAGLITYMRTDSPQVAASAIEETRAYINQRFGKEYLPASARRYQTKSKVAQEAHEAIRPTNINRHPDSVRQHLSADHLRLYDLIWKRMVASQMADAALLSTRIDITARNGAGQQYAFRATGSVVKFAGFRTLYGAPHEAQDEEEQGERERTLPEMREGNPLQCLGLKPDQHFTEPPARYTEASLIRALEERGIGRPSTYAPTIGTLMDRQYVVRDKGALHSTRLGQVVSDQLMNHFPTIMDFDFTAQLEERLDEVANGKRQWVPLLEQFYEPFTDALARAQEEMPRVRVEEPTEETCEKCGRPMVIKRGRFGPFLACTGFPECRNTRRIVQKSGAKCPRCATGDLVQRRGKGRTFYGCSNYPDCDFTVAQRPLPYPCPECDGLLVAAGRDRSRCTNCAYRGPIQQEEVEAA